MKRLAIIILALMVMPFIGLSTVCSEEQEEPKEWTLAADPFLWPVCNDTIQKMVEGKEFLLLRLGRLWSILLNDEKYSIIYGNDNYDKWMTASLNRAVPIVKWGMDSLPIQAKRMTPKHRQAYVPFSEILRLYSVTGDLLFENMDIESYTGPDSKSFDKHIGELRKLMFTYPLIYTTTLMNSGK